MEYLKVGKYYEVFSGYAFKSQDLKETADIPIIKIGNISNGRNVINENMQFVSKELLGINKKYYVNRGDVLLSLTGSHMNQPNSVVGRSCRNYSDRLYLLNQRAGKIVPKNNASLSYIYYVLQTQAMKEMICCRAYGAANQVNVSPKSIMSIKWNFPSSDVQHRIASILSTYDTFIENNTKRIRLLEKMAENLYKEWFVRFRFPGHENVEMENGLHKGWKVEKLGEWGIELETGKRPKGGIDGSIKDGCPSLGAECIKELASFDYSSVKMVPKDFYDSLKRGKNSGNDILLYKDGAYIGKVTMFRDSFPYSEYSINEHVFFLSPMNIKYRNYLYFTLHQKEFFAVMQILNRNAAQPGLSRSDVERIKIVVPPSKIVELFDLQVERMLKVIFSLAKQNSLLARQRDLLLPRLMSGKLEVKVKE